MARTTQTYPRPGLWNVGSYQVSGIPWVSGSAIAGKTMQMMEFPYVCKSFTIINTGSVANHICVHFSSGTGETPVLSNGRGGQQTYAGGPPSSIFSGSNHYISIPGNSGSMTFDVKCARVYVTNPGGLNGVDHTGYQIFAELTGIPIKSMFELIGAGITNPVP